MAWLVSLLSVILSIGIATSHAKAGVPLDRLPPWAFRSLVSLDADGALDATGGQPPPKWQVAQAVPLATPPSAPVKPPHVIFSDHFAGTAVGDTWQVVNGNPDHYVVEDGDLLIIASSVGDLGTDKAENIFRLKKPLPDGDWVITIKLNVDIQTARENFTFGVMDGPRNYLAARLYSEPADCCRPNHYDLKTIKIVGDQTTEFVLPASFPAPVAQPIAVRLKKDGFLYRAGINLAGLVDKSGNPVWSETSALTSLHPLHIFALNAAQWERTTGETPFRVISVTIEQDGK